MSKKKKESRTFLPIHTPTSSQSQQQQISM